MDASQSDEREATSKLEDFFFRRLFNVLPTSLLLDHRLGDGSKAIWFPASTSSNDRSNVQKPL